MKVKIVKNEEEARGVILSILPELLGVAKNFSGLTMGSHMYRGRIRDLSESCRAFRIANRFYECV